LYASTSAVSSRNSSRLVWKMVVTAPTLIVTWPPANDSVCTLTTKTMMIRRIMSNATMCGRLGV
jgi:hypothetical protein